jgi:uncharacterized protein (DUF2164 family)
MTIKLDQQAEEYLLKSIRQFFKEELDGEIGDLKARSVLEFCVREIGASVYNQAIGSSSRPHRSSSTHSATCCASGSTSW